MKKRFGFTLEDLQDGEVVEEVVVAEEIDEVEPEEFDEDEIEQSDDADIIEEAIDQVGELSEGLEAICDRMMLALADGGMSKQTADFADMAIQSTCGNWMNTSKVMPSLESFDEAGGRMAATGYAIEAIKDTITGAWAKIVSLTSKWFASAKLLFEKLTVTANTLAKRAKQLESRAAAHKGTPETATLSVGTSVYRNVSKDGGVSDVKANIASIIPVLGSLQAESPIGKIIDGLSKELLTVAAKDTASVTSVFKALTSKYDIDAVSKHFQSLSNIKFKAGVGKFAPTHTKHYLVSTDALVGGNVIVVKIEAEVSGWLKSITATLVADPAHALGKAGDLKALKASEIVALAKSIGEVAAAITGSKTDLAHRQGQFKTILDENKRIGKNLEMSLIKYAIGVNVEHDKVNAYIKAYLKGISKMSMSMMQPDLSIQRQALASAKAAYNYGVKSLRNLKTAEVTKEAPAEKTEDA